jgi:uncharacterized protein (TIGR04222 family)
VSAVEAAGPIAETFDFFPFNVGPGTEFLLVYAVIGLVGLLVAKAAQALVLGLMTPVRPPPPRQQEGYRHAATQPRHLAVGTFPSIDDVLHIAYLRAEKAGVAEAILTQATAEGWIRPASEAPGRLAVFPLPNEASHASRELAVNLHATYIAPADARRAAALVADRKVPELHNDLVGMGLLHSDGARFWAVITYAAIAAVVLGIGAIRTLRGIELDRPVAFLVIEILVFGAVLAKLARPAKRTSHGEMFLAWVMNSTVSLREDVRSGRAQRPIDLALAGATAGLFAVPIVAAMWPAPAAASTVFGGTSDGSFSASSCSSSSCSSSSCGGGGGCGSSCGGGGGCGG